MKQSISFSDLAVKLFLVSLLVAIGCAAPEAPYRVFILAGQSNMVGSGEVAALDSAARALPANVTLFDHGLRANLEQRAHRFGPELTFAQRLAEVFPEDAILLIKYAVGGSSLFDWAPDWSEADAQITGNPAFGPLYDKMMDRVAAITSGKAVRFEAVLWMQGERDARIPRAGKDYYVHFETLITRLRNDLNTPALPILFGRVNPPPERYPARDLVNEAQEKIAVDLAFTYLVDTDGLSKLDDDLHYNTEGQQALGRRFADTYLNLLRR